MNKPELIEEINKLPDDIEFLKSKDDEGNGYQWLSGLSIEYIHKSEANDYEIDNTISEDDANEEYTKEEIESDLKRVAVLW